MYQWYNICIIDTFLRKRCFTYGDKIEISQLGKKIYITHILKLIKDDKYNIILREKNKVFIYKYKLNKEKIKKILLSLTEDDIQYELEDKEYVKYGNEKLIVFKKDIKLLDFYGSEITRIYIKIKKKENELPIISFHDSERKGVN